MTVFCLSLVCWFSCAQPAPVQSLSTQFEEAVAAQQEEKLDELFRSRPYEVVYLIDDHLLSFAESEGVALERLRLAQRAARVADRVFDEQIFSLQAAAIEKLNGDQRARLLLGRQALRAGREAQREKLYEQSAQAYAEALAAANEVGDRLGVARAEQALADLAVGGKRFDEALRRHQLAQGLFRRFRHPSELRSCRALAMLLERRGEFGPARSQLERMLVLAAESGRSTDTSEVKQALVRVCSAMGDGEAAKHYAGSSKDGL